MCRIVHPDSISEKEASVVTEEVEYIIGYSKLPPWLQEDIAIAGGMQRLGLESSRGDNN